LWSTTQEIGQTSTHTFFQQGDKADISGSAAPYYYASGNWVMTSNGSPQTTDFAQVGVMEEQGQSGLWVFYDYASSSTYYAPVLVTAAFSGTAYNFSGKYDTINKFYYLYL